MVHNGNSSCNRGSRRRIVALLSLSAVIAGTAAACAVPAQSGGNIQSSGVAETGTASGGQESSPGQSGEIAQSTTTGNAPAAESGQSGSSAASEQVQSSAGNSAAEATGPEASICGLEGDVVEVAYLDTAPQVDRWEYDGIFAYPISKKYGPGATADEGYRYCFQRSPEGALYAATNTSVQFTNYDTRIAWANYFVAEGPHREEVLSKNGGEKPSHEGARIEISGYKLLAYDGTNARVDVAMTVTVSGQTTILSYIYDLVWQNGDWKLNVKDPENAANMARLSDLNGYVPWGPSQR